MPRSKSVTSKPNEKEFLEARLRDAAREVAQLDLKNLVLTQERNQALAAFHFIKILHEAAEKSATVGSLYRNVVMALCSELSMDAAAIIEADLQRRHMEIIAAQGLPDSTNTFKLIKSISNKQLRLPTFVNSNSTPKAFHKFMLRRFPFSHFLWHPIEFDDDRILALYAANRFEDLMKKQPFTEASLDTFGAIASVIQLRGENIRKTRDLLDRRQERIDFLAQLVKTSPIPVVACDHDGLITYINPATEKTFGYKAAELVGQSPEFLIAGRNARMLNDEIMRHIGKGKTWRGEMLTQRRNGEAFYSFASIYQLLDKKGEFLAYVGFLEDIHDRKTAEEERARLSIAIEQSAESVVITDADGSIEYVNPAFETITGYSRDEVIGRNPRILKSGRHDREFYAEMWRTITKGEVWNGHLTNKRKDGEFFEEKKTISAIRDGQGKIVNYISLGRDVTREMEIESLLRQAQKMEAVGQLAGGVAHDFNNIVQAIQGYTQLALVGLPPTEKRHSYLQQIFKGTEHAASLTQQLLAFSRRQILKPQNINLNNEIEHVLKMLQRVIGEHIELKIVPDTHLNDIRADVGQIQQVLMNLCVNARDAMPEGGTIVIRTQNVYVDSAFCESRSWGREGDYVLLSISDSGEGMTLEVREHIFEPFFTTKELGKGTGLGLATVYGVVKQHEGMIDVYSEPGHGATFDIYLPALKRPARKKQKTEEKPFRLGHETVLLAEDDELVRSLAVQILEKAGYRVLIAKDGAEAISLFKKHKNAIQLALLDVVMPKINGRLVYEYIRKIKPRLPVLFSSGYSAQAIEAQFIECEKMQLITKPYAPSDLLEKMRDILDYPNNK